MASCMALTAAMSAGSAVLVWTAEPSASNA